MTNPVPACQFQSIEPWNPKGWLTCGAPAPFVAIDPTHEGSAEIPLCRLHATECKRSGFTILLAESEVASTQKGA